MLPLALSPEPDSSLTSNGMDRDTAGLTAPVTDDASSLMLSSEAPNSRSLVDSKPYNFLGCYANDLSFAFNEKKNTHYGHLYTRGLSYLEACYGACKSAGYSESAAATSDFCVA